MNGTLDSDNPSAISHRRIVVEAYHQRRHQRGHQELKADMREIRQMLFTHVGDREKHS